MAIEKSSDKDVIITAAFLLTGLSGCIDKIQSSVYSILRDELLKNIFGHVKCFEGIYLL